MRKAARKSNGRVDPMWHGTSQSPPEFSPYHGLDEGPSATVQRVKESQCLVLLVSRVLRPFRFGDDHISLCWVRLVLGMLYILSDRVAGNSGR